jgi:hypothetical protein
MYESPQARRATDFSTVAISENTKMRVTLGLTRVFAGGFAAALLAFACSDDTTPGDEPQEAGAGGSSGGSSSGGKAGSGGASMGGKSSGGTNSGGGGSGTGGKGGKGTGGGMLDGGDGGAVELSLCPPAHPT